MATLKILANNAVDLSTATLTAVTADASYPATNLADPTRSKVCRTTSDADGREFRVSWSADVSVDCIALCRHNLGDSAQWRVRTYAATNWTGTPLQDSGTVDAYNASLLGANATITDTDVRGLKNSVVYFGTTSTTVQSAHIYITGDTANPDNYFEASRLFVGVTTSLTLNAAPGAELSWGQDAKQFRTDGGSLRTWSAGPPWREMRIEMRNFSAADRKIWSDLYRYLGTRRDFWFSLYPGNGDELELEHQGQFKFKSTGGIRHDLPVHWGSSYVITEA